MRNLLTLFDLDKSAFDSIMADTPKFKNRTYHDKFLANKNIGLIFEKPSTRTRVSAEVAVGNLGGNAIYLGSSELQLNRGESVEDTAKVLSRYLDGLIIRSKSHTFLEKFSEHSEIPVINALSDKAHPLQILADFHTIVENGLDMNRVNMCFLGDGQNNVCRSLMEGFTFYNGLLNIAAPEVYFPDKSYLDSILSRGGRIKVFSDPHEAVLNSDVLYTDVWVSMGYESESEVRKTRLKSYQISMDTIRATRAKPIVMHCLPAQKGEEISAEAFSSPNSKIFDQAENRLYSLQAVLKYCFSG
ncbi:MAG: ornithine carbamoyltransferase [Spirochaetia bacterium]|nr:ornithine carbamoyltransferase [Spirochaetia bacterium]